MKLALALLKTAKFVERIEIMHKSRKEPLSYIGPNSLDGFFPLVKFTHIPKCYFRGEI